jgi:hypothetical protein
MYVLFLFYFILLDEIWWTRKGYQIVFIEVQQGWGLPLLPCVDYFDYAADGIKGIVASTTQIGI